MCRTEVKHQCRRLVYDEWKWMLNWCRIHEKVQTNFQKSTVQGTASMSVHLQMGKGQNQGTQWMVVALKLLQNEGLKFGLSTALVTSR